MSEELKYPKWQAEFDAAASETDPEKLIEKIQKFETAVFVRLQELALSGDHLAERKAIADATNTVRLRKNRLSGHRDWK